MGFNSGFKGLKFLAADGIRTPDRPPPSVATTLATKTLILVSSLSPSPRLVFLDRFYIITAARSGGDVMQRRRFKKSARSARTRVPQFQSCKNLGPQML